MAVFLCFFNRFNTPIGSHGGGIAIFLKFLNTIMNITLEDIDIAYARVCGSTPLDKMKVRFRSEIDEILCAQGADRKSELPRFTDEQIQFLKDRKIGA